MARGRPRKVPHNLPRHIDYARVPAGIYWNPRGAGRWYVRDRTEDGRTKARTVAGPAARLSDLHAIAESRAGVDRKLLRSMLTAFHASDQFKARSKATREDYGYCLDRLAELTTKQGTSVLDLETRKIPRPLVQRLVDRIAQGRKRDAAGDLIPTPSTAVHVLRYLSVAFRWGANRGWCDGNPAAGVEAPQERKRRRLPVHATYADLATFARARATTRRGVKGSVAPYLADVAELAYLCRLRGIEIVVDLNDADVTEEGLVCRRRKGSLTTVTKWDPRLRAAIDRLQDLRAHIWTERKRPVPMRPEDRPLVVSVYGYPLSKRGFNSAWQRLVRSAIEQGVIPEGARFGLHDLKRRGITDTAGTRGEKKRAPRHRQEATMDVYDLEVPVVESAAASVAKNRKQR